METPVLKTGAKAYFDSFSGLVPVSVLAVTAPEEKPLFDLAHGGARASIKVRCKVTADHGPYKKGQELENSSLSVVPRGAIRRTQYSSLIGYYQVQAD